MSLLTRIDRERIEGLRADLASLPLGGTPGAESALEPFRVLIDADQALSHTWAWTSEGIRLGEFFATHSSRSAVQPTVDRVAAQAGRRFSYYDPARPEAAQRNRAVRRSTMPRLSRNPQAAYLKIQDSLGFSGDEMRALICDGDTLLWWIGGYRQLGFTNRSVAAFNQIIPALRRRLVVERFLVEGEFLRRGLEAALEAIPGSAFIVQATRGVQWANRAARGQMGADATFRRRSLEEWRSAASVHPMDVFLPIDSPGLHRHALVVLRSTTAPSPHRAPPALWVTLSPRQREVHEELCRGRSNRAIAGLLGISERTVEQHVTAILRVAGCSSRSELVAQALAEHRGSSAP